jgi:hypothetical protein
LTWHTWWQTHKHLMANTKKQEDKKLLKKLENC